MIICSCNVLSEAQILETLKLGVTPGSVGLAYRCLGCAPRCGRCLETVRALLQKAHLDNCRVGCPTCPEREHAHVDARAEDSRLVAVE